MVAALNVDYARLETLENEMADWNEDSTVQPWSLANPTMQPNSPNCAQPLGL